MTILVAIFMAYILTVVITSGSIFEGVRGKLKILTPSLTHNGRHFIECRLCVGFWISCSVALILNENIFLTYGASYFLATQERR